jgi:hypothetical protein|tara:strand:+ start:1190 stop:1588 length:399 start_codon:yes stop_codon:yes gene_type:complete
LNDNVIEFPTKYKGKNVPIIDDLDAVKMREDLDFADNLAEGLMINLIHNVGENGFDIKKDRFIGDISFLNEVVRGALYRQMGFSHPMQSFMDLIVKTEISKEDEQIVTKVNLKKIDELLPQSKDDGSGDDTS